MSIKVNFIKGNNRSACRNDAYAVIEVKNGQETTPLAIIPVYELPGINAETLKTAFETALADKQNCSYENALSCARTLLKKNQRFL